MDSITEVVEPSVFRLCFLALLNQLTLLLPQLLDDCQVVSLYAFPAHVLAGSLLLFLPLLLGRTLTLPLQVLKDGLGFSDFSRQGRVLLLGLFVRGHIAFLEYGANLRKGLPGDPRGLLGSLRPLHQVERPLCL
jgi:hypothetical protein